MFKTFLLNKKNKRRIGIRLMQNMKKESIIGLARVLRRITLECFYALYKIYCGKITVGKEWEWIN